MSYKIGSFNLYKCSFQSDKDIRKDFLKIANIIISEQFDIVAVQEMLNPNAAGLLKRYLGSNWYYRWEKPLKSSFAAAEGYAFFWNSRTMSLAPTEEIEGDSIVVKSAEPRIFNQYRITAPLKPLLRNPYYGRFKPNRGFCEIRLINIHLRYRKGGYLESSATELRKREFYILTHEIYRRISNKRYGNNLPAYTIMLGDYNLNLKRHWTKSPYLEEVVIVNDGGMTQRLTTLQDQLTTLKRIDELQSGCEYVGDQEQKLRGYSNNYDHMTIDENRFKGTGVRVRRIDTVRKYSNDDFDKHRREISDHIPICMDIDLLSRR